MSPPILIKQTKSKNSSNGAVRKKLNFHIFLKSQNKERSEDLLILSARCWTGASGENKTIFEICSTKSDFLFGSFFLCMFIVWRAPTTKSLRPELSFCRGPSSYALWRLDVPADASLDWPVLLQSSLFEKGGGSRIE